MPKEVVNFEYTRKHKSYDEGTVTEIIQASPDRVIPECPYFTICGGCSLQHLNHSKQIALKAEMLQEQLAHFGNIKSKTILEPITGPVWEYRSRARLSAKYVKKQKLLVGFHEKNGRFVADIDSCAILHKNVGQKISELKILVRSLSIYEHVPQIEVATANNTTALIFRILQTPTAEDLELFKNFGTLHNMRIYLQPGGVDTVHCINSDEQYLNYKLPSYNLELLFQPTDFTQINQEINQQMVTRALDFLNPESHETILDLFCGLGNFTLPIAQKCKNIVGVEGSSQMTKRAQFNAEHNQIKNALFYSADLSKELLASWAQQKYDKILLDPPRTGALEICKQIKKFGAKKIIYISCNPATLARDAKELAEHGYKLKKTGIIDMFPHTSHAEAIAEFV